jgi:hypothetical protein
VTTLTSLASRINEKRVVQTILFGEEEGNIVFIMKLVICSSIALAMALSVVPASSFSAAGGLARAPSARFAFFVPSRVSSRVVLSSSESGKGESDAIDVSSSTLSSSETGKGESDAIDVSSSTLSEEETEKIGNLVADDEWMGLTMELSELVRVAVIQDVKTKTSEFIGKDEYKVSK